MQLVTDERRIDRGKEFNQTEEHDHRPGRECFCGFGVGSTHKPGGDHFSSAQNGKNNVQGVLGKPVSPAIREQTIINLRRELSFANNDRRELADKLAVANKRIAGFERMTATMAIHIDKIYEAFQTAFGQTPEGFLTAIADDLKAVNSEPLKAA